MALRDAILALSPTIYWPMDDTSSSIAADASGNGHVGSILTGTAVGAPGPELDTTCFAGSMFDAGIQLAGTNPLTGTGPFTMLIWHAAVAMTTFHKVLIYNGLSNSTGVGETLNNTIIDELYGGLGVRGTGFSLTLGFWHQVAFRFRPSIDESTFLDGAAPNTAAAGIPNTVVGSNPALAQTPNPGLIAHAAFWNTALSDADIAGIFAAGPGNPPAPAVTGRNATDVDILALENKLDTILASVRRMYF